MEDGLKRVRDATDELRAMIAESQHVIAESVQLLEFVQALQSPLIPTEPPLRRTNEGVKNRAQSGT